MRARDEENEILLQPFRSAPRTLRDEQSKLFSLPLAEVGCEYVLLGPKAKSYPNRMRLAVMNFGLSQLAPGLPTPHDLPIIFRWNCRVWAAKAKEGQHVQRNYLT